MLSKFLTRCSLKPRTLSRFYNVERKKAIQDEHYLSKHLLQKIKVGGPISVAEYMKEVLTNPATGYYMTRDVFGEKGDFITSPEITQMFGEMIAVWFLNEWQKFGSPIPLQFVELGPGRGTLSNDMLNVFGHFKSLHRTSLHLIEVSPYLSDIQARNLCNTVNAISNSVVYREGTQKHGIPVKWYRHLDDVPKGFSLFLAHEFFDALPIHKFHKTYYGYREVLVDADLSEEKDKPSFKYVLSKNITPMGKALLKKNESREHVEVAPESLLICENICRRLKENGGIALFCDYGHNGEGTDTFRAFKKHVQVNPLETPGQADLTADVDFNIFREVAQNVGGLITYGPVSQRDFLLRVGLEYRFKSLLKKIGEPEHIKNLKECYNMLVNEDKMGKRYKFFAIIPETLKKILDKLPVVGF